MAMRKTVSPVLRPPVTEGWGQWGGTRREGINEDQWYEPGGRSPGWREVYKFIICGDWDWLLHLWAEWDLEDYIPLDRYPGCFCQIKWQVEGMCREKAEGTRELVYCGQGIIDLGYNERSEREGL